MTQSWLRNPVPVDARRADWPRRVADDLNNIARGYIFAFFFTDAPAAGETMCLHPCAERFSIPADWGPYTEDAVVRYAGVVPSVDTNPTSSWAMDIKRKRKGESSYSTIGTWTVTSGGVFSATTLTGDQQDMEAGDVLKFIAPAVADATAANMSFTIYGR